MLKRPIRESDQPATAGGRPHSATTFGRCVAMNATWKPQTKKPAARRRKLGSCIASRTAWRIDFSGGAPCAPEGCRPRSGQASGTMASESSPSAVRAPTQPSIPVRRTASGATTNWPNEPPALTMPLARPRFSGGTARATADISTPRPAMPPPPAAITPMRSTSIQVVLACGVSTVPSITSTAPVATTRPVPYLSAIAPAIGCVMPHMSCATANARLIDAMPRPVAELSGPMKSATDCRTPKMSANTRPAATMSPSWRRVIAPPACQAPSAPRLPERRASRRSSLASPRYDERNIPWQKNSAGRAAHQLARRFTDTFGQLRIVHRPREQQRTNQRSDDRHRFLVRGALSPFGELLLDETDELLDATGDGAAHFGTLTRHLGAGRRDRAAQALLGGSDV